MILITGGSGSGKSEYGEYRVMEEQMPLRFYVACMEVYGEEGRRKAQRPVRTKLKRRRKKGCHFRVRVQSGCQRHV